MKKGILGSIATFALLAVSSISDSFSMTQGPQIKKS
jgi:hypothetical protein